MGKRYSYSERIRGKRSDRIPINENIRSLKSYQHVPGVYFAAIVYLHFECDKPHLARVLIDVSIDNQVY